MMLPTVLGQVDPKLGPCLALCGSRQSKETRFGKAEQKVYALIKELGRERSCFKDFPRGEKRETFKG